MRFSSLALLVVVTCAQAQVNEGVNRIVVPCHGGGGPCTTTTTTLPGCSGPGEVPCGTCGGAGGACFPHNPDNLCTCADIGSGGEACDLGANCTFDGGCAPGNYCFDARSLGGPNGICCPLCPSGTSASTCPPTTTTTSTTTTLPPCNSPLYCVCRDDFFGTCTTDADCPPGLVCRDLDGTNHCYRRSCTVAGDCDSTLRLATCDVVCTGLSGPSLAQCMDATCVGGARDGLECFTGQAVFQCPGGTCDGTPVCDCQFGSCFPTTTTTTIVTTTTTSTTTLPPCSSPDFCVCVDDPTIPCANDGDCPAGQSCQTSTCKHRTCTSHAVGGDCDDSGISACNTVCVDLGGTASADCHADVCDCTTTTTSSTTTTTAP